MKYHRHLLISCVDALSDIFFGDRHADKCIEYYMRNNKKWGSHDRRFFAETVYDCVRWWRLDWYLLDRPESKPDLAFLAPTLWRRGLPMPLMDEFQGIDCTKFVDRSKELKNPAIKEAMPDWLYQYMEKELGEHFKEMIPYFNQVNQLVLRVNTSKTTIDELIAALAKEDIQAKPLLGTETGVIIDVRTNIFRTEIFKKGHFEVQDGSSQQVAPFLDIQPGMRVIDACAGAGGKSLHISDILKNKGKVVCLDIHPWKLEQLKLRARRNSYSNIEMKAIESAKVIKRLKASADRILLDVPCSGLGVLRRNPDTKWKVSETSIKEMVALQEKILSEYGSMLKAGGKMVYSTCSVLPIENEKQVEKFLKNNDNYTLLKQKHIYPTREGYDGFYMALMQKN